jgi:hypothetical protein
MAGGQNLFDRLDALGDECQAFLETARGVAVSQFGERQVSDVPLLVVQTAQLMAALDHNRIVQEKT